MDRRQRPSRAGFTLVEVLIVILIIGTLIAILLPAIAGAFRTAKNGQVTAELNNLATALASFKTTYGDYPPSRIILSEEGFNLTLARPEFATRTMVTGADANDSDITFSDLAQRSLLYLRKFWPRADFNGTQIDINNNNKNDGYYIISGAECLTFFLGGTPTLDSTGHIAGLTGFNKLPTLPFMPQNKLPTNPFGVANAANNTALNRTAPNYEFNNGRLIDLDGDGIPSYIDPLDITPGNRRSYAYFSSYGTNSYDPNDVNGFGHIGNAYELEEDGVTDVERGFTVGFPIFGQATPPFTAISPGPNPYCSSDPISTTGVVSWINPNSFQLFSAGQDRYWGLGGTYVQNSLGSTGKLPILPNPPDLGNVHNDNVTGIRNREADNLTNFSGGRLD